MRKVKSLMSILILMCFYISITSEINAQVFQKKDSIYFGDTLSIINPTGNIEKMGFTLWSTAIGDTLWPQVKYWSDTQWVNTSVKNVRLQTSDTIIRISPNSWPMDYELNDPVVTAFRLRSTGAYVTTRKVFINFRYRKRQ